MFEIDECRSIFATFFENPSQLFINLRFLYLHTTCTVVYISFFLLCKKKLSLHFIKCIIVSTCWNFSVCIQFHWCWCSKLFNMMLSCFWTVLNLWNICLKLSVFGASNQLIFVELSGCDVDGRCWCWCWCWYWYWFSLLVTSRFLLLHISLMSVAF